MSVEFTLAPTHLDSEDYRLGWEAATNEARAFFLPILRFTRKFWRKRREKNSADRMRLRQLPLDEGMCTVSSCDARSEDGEFCELHGRRYRKDAAHRQRDRRARIAGALQDRAPLLAQMRRGPFTED